MSNNPDQGVTMTLTGPSYPTREDTVADGGFFTGGAIGVTGTLPRGTTIPEAFRAALDWHVESDVALNGTTLDVVPNLKLLRRSDTGRVIGWGKDGFTPIQNADCADILTGGLADTPHEVAAALSLRQGARTAVVIAFPELAGELNVDGDRIAPFLALSNSFDGSSALRLLPVWHRKGCTNMLGVFWNRAGAKEAVVSVRHTRNAAAAFADVREAVRRFAIVNDEFQAEVARLIDTELTRAQETAITDIVAPLPTGEDVTARRRRSAERRRDAIVELYRHDTRVGFTGTAWGMLQAVSTFEQNDSGFRSSPTGAATRGERKFIRALDGGVHERRAWQAIDRVLTSA